MKKVKRYAVLALVIYLLGAIALFLLQDTFILRPKPFTADHIDTFSFPHESVLIALEGNDTLAFTKIPAQVFPARGIVIYFHGNRDNVERYYPFASIFTRNGYEVWMPDYPGFGYSRGEISENKLYEQADSLYNRVIANVSPAKIIIYGKSLGTGIAAYLAAHAQASMLILETPYYDLPAVIGSYAFMYPVRSIIKYKFPVWKYLKHVNYPVVVFAGREDGVIRYSGTKKLIPLMKTKDRFFTVENAGHNEVNLSSLYYSKMDSLLAF